MFRKNMLIRKVQRFWRARRQARKQGTTIENPFQASIDSFKRSKSFKGLYGPENTVQYSEDITCITCGDKLATRQCNECGKNTTQCDQCFVAMHSRGVRRRHTYMRIVYTHHSEVDFEQELERRVSMKSIPERD